MHLDAACGEPLEELARRLARAEGVVDEAHLDAGFRALHERRGEHAADLVVVEDVRFEMHVVLRASDHGEHRGIGRLAVLEQRHLVADVEGIAGERFLDRDVALEERGIGRALLEVGEDLLALCARERAARAFEPHLRGLGLEQEAVDVGDRARAREDGERGRR